MQQRGFPGKSLVGAEGASAAWLIAQHSSHDRGFQRGFLSLMEVALAAGEAEPRHYAHLIDRVRLASGQPQVYGTQYQRDGQYILLRDGAQGLRGTRHRRGCAQPAFLQ